MMMKSYTSSLSINEEPSNLSASSPPKLAPLLLFKPVVCENIS